jgi:hypothetical protein
MSTKGVRRFVMEYGSYRMAAASALLQIFTPSSKNLSATCSQWVHMEKRVWGVQFSLTQLTYHKDTSK